MMLFDRSDITEKEYVRRVLSRLNNLNADAFQCNVSVPFPGTKLYEQYAHEGKLSFVWDLFDPGGSQLPYSAKLNLARIKRKIYVGFAFTHPFIILKTLAQMRRKSVLSVSKRFMSYVLQMLF